MRRLSIPCWPRRFGLGYFVWPAWRRDEDFHQVHRQLRGICSIHIGQHDYTCFALGKDHEKRAGALLTSAVSYVQFAQTFAGPPSQRIFGCGTICQSLRSPHDIPGRAPQQDIVQDGNFKPRHVVRGG